MLNQKQTIMFNLGYTYKKPTTLFGTQNAKTIKGEQLGYTTYILYMSPQKQNTLGKNICPKATAGCAAACLFTAGRGKFSNVMKGRLNKTEYFLRERENFMNDVAKEIAKGIKKHGADKMCVRLNGTSDIPYENIPVGGFKNIMEMFPNLQFYDYSKNPKRFTNKLPKNYHLTFSMAETKENKEDCFKLLNAGFNVASVFAVNNESELPNTYKGYDVINGDEHDLVWLHKSNTKQGLVIGLKAKGDAKKDTTGFVIRDF
jgi:hypothetical protein